METRVINGELFLKMVRGGAANLNAKRQIVNELNVFPVPDGDTGDNMFMTIDAGCGQSAEATLGETAKSVSKGMLLGARGNSGVILSKIFAGISEGLEGADDADVNLFGEALEKGIDASYGAVANPVEGTMLSVNRDAVRFANSKIDNETTFEKYFDNYVEELNASLERTPDQLDVLKEAGVVDSGGAGLVYIAEGMKNVLNGVEPDYQAPAVAAHKIDVSTFDENSELEFGYCTEFLLRLQNSKVKVDEFDEKEIVDYLMAVGESVVAFRDGSIIKVHVHTMHPGEILNECQKYGEFLTLKIENMMLQHNESTVKNGFEKMKPHKRYGIVAVASGAGMKQTFSELGVDEVIDGGQSMNPSAEDFIKAFEEINADTILVFPNNPNIILTAKQAAEIYGKNNVKIIPSRTVGEGYSAISVLDTQNENADEVVAEAAETAAATLTGIVAQAVRDTEKDGVKVVKGDYIGYDSHDTIYTDRGTAEEAAAALAEQFDAGKYDVLLIICGERADGDKADALYAELSSKYRRTEVIMINGGQAIEEYIMVLE
ncbi:MAG: DAK2 domain-containing protein [Clostridia bacterium]|nr:DAK2 domain-containing protein [Clostridia bacterium]